jgi:peroxiredoxin
MRELDQLEKRHEDFAKKGVRIVVISNDDLPTAQQTQTDFPHLVVVADMKQALASAMDVIHPGMGPNQSDTNAPTTFLVDRTGTVRWFFRPDRFLARLSADELLAAIAAPLRE